MTPTGVLTVGVSFLVNVSPKGRAAEQKPGLLSTSELGLVTEQASECITFG